MTEKITYFAMIDEFTSRDNPRTVLRRVRNDEGTIDEIFLPRPKLGVLAADVFSRER
jgi:hypothetical protein